MGKNKELRSWAALRERRRSLAAKVLNCSSVDSFDSWFKRAMDEVQKRMPQHKKRGRCWKLPAFPVYLTGRNYCNDVWWRTAFVCWCLLRAGMIYFCQHFQSPFWKERTCSQKSGFPSSWPVPYHLMKGCSFSCFSDAEGSSVKLLPGGALLESRKHKENNKMSSCVPHPL